MSLAPGLVEVTTASGGGELVVGTDIVLCDGELFDDIVMCVFTYTCWDLSESMVVKRASGGQGAGGSCAESDHTISHCNMQHRRSNWGLWCQKQVSQAGISNCIPQYSVGCNYLSLPEITASGAKVFMQSARVSQDLSLASLNMLWCEWKFIQNQ